MTPCRAPRNLVRVASVAIAFDYGSAPDPVRDDIPAAHRRVWNRIASPGTWWSGAERVALAAAARAARDCGLCRVRKQALSPAEVEGAHTAQEPLAPPTIDIVHRLVTDPGRLTQRWLEAMLASGLSPEQYVEIVGVVTSVVSVDAFHRALGLELEPLPEPRVGEPSRYRPASARSGSAWVPMIPAGANGGAEADLWPRGRSANVMRALSLVPDEVRNLGDLSAAHYLPMHRVADPTARAGVLDRSQMELLAGRVSALRECFY